MNQSTNICPIASLMNIISKKWVLLIIRSIACGANCYSNIEKELSDINPAILSSRLKELQDTGLLEKNIVSQNPLKIEYRLTKK